MRSDKFCPPVDLCESYEPIFWLVCLVGLDPPDKLSDTFRTDVEFEFVRKFDAKEGRGEFIQIFRAQVTQFE